MAWNTINYSCGHTDKIQIYGKMSDREEKKSRMEKYECKNCREKKHEEINNKAIEIAVRINLPELIGSKKQIAWANTIRIGMIQKIMELEKTISPNQSVEQKEKLEMAETTLLEKKEAAFWIEHRSLDAYNILTLMLEAGKK